MISHIIKKITSFKRYVCFFSLLFLSQTLYANATHDLPSLTPTNEYQVLLLSTTMNGYDSDDVSVFLLSADNQLYVSQDILETWNIVIPSASSVIYDDQPYYELQQQNGVLYTIDQSDLSIDLTIPVAYFTSNQVTLNQLEPLKLSTPATGLLFDYVALAEQVDDQQQVSGLFTPSVFSRYGSGSSQFLALSNHSNSNDVNQKSGITRLNTTWRKDNPQTMQTLTLGDSYSSIGAWGNSVGFAGIQSATNYGLQPYFITYPLPSVEGEAVLPSTVDLLVAGIPVGKTKFNNAGLFDINTIPVVNGSGMLEVVTTDILGRQQSISVPFYVSNQLLKPGLQQYSYEMGLIRNNFSIESNDYGPLFTSFTQRQGFSDHLTAGVHGELLVDQQTVGIESTYLLGTFAELSLASAVSQGPLGMGTLGSIGLQRRALDGISYGATAQATTRAFAQLGLTGGEIDNDLDDADHLPPALQQTAFMGLPSWYGYSASVAYVRQNNRDNDNISFLNINMTKTIFKDYALGLVGLVGVDGLTSNTLFLTISHSLGNQTYTNAGTVSQQGNGSSGFAQVAKSMGFGPDWGYNLYAEQGEQNNYQAGLVAQNEIGAYSLNAASHDGSTGMQAQISGSAVWLDNQAYLLRDVYDSFALVQLPGYSNVRVYAENQEIGRTDGNGNIFVPQLLSYQQNKIAVEPKDLPMDVTLATDQQIITPYYKTGVIIEFPLLSKQTATVQLKQTSGEPVPSGATLENITAKTMDLIGEDGDAYLSNLLMGINHFKASWNDKQCTFSIDYEKNIDPVPDLGVVECQ